jgi:hypothetical protein
VVSGHPCTAVKWSRKLRHCGDEDTAAHGAARARRVGAGHPVRLQVVVGRRGIAAVGSVGARHAERLHQALCETAPAVARVAAQDARPPRSSAEQLVPARRAHRVPLQVQGYTVKSKCYPRLRERETT